jgi:hypothetical protein
MQDRIDCVKVLIRFEANPNFLDREKKKPLNCCYDWLPASSGLQKVFQAYLVRPSSK